MTLTQYIESKERELAHYVREKNFQTGRDGNDAMTLWLIATSRITFLEREIIDLKRQAKTAMLAKLSKAPKA